MPSIPLTDTSTGSTAAVLPERGFNCYAFQAKLGEVTVDVIDSEPGFADGAGRPSGNGIPILFPYPNRIREGKYSWDGTEYHIPSEAVSYDANGNAIHGFCLDRPWRVIEQGDNFAVGQFQLSVDAPDRLAYWPGDCLIEVRYELRGRVLHSRMRFANPGETTIPWGFGTHAYFRLPLADNSAPEHCLIQVPADSERVLIDCLPTGEVKPISSEKDLREGEYFDQLRLDDVLTGVTTENNILECAIIDEKAGLQIVQRSEAIFPDLVVFTPPGRNAVCIEPYTCSTDAVNLQAQGIEAGLRTLEPGAEVTTWIDIEVGPVVA